MKAYQRQEDGDNKLVEVGGRNVKLKEWEGFEFFYYKQEKTDAYHIIEKSTGLSVGWDYMLADARENALYKLNGVGRVKFQKMLADELAKR